MNKLLLLALAAGATLAVQAARADEVRTYTDVDPITGTRTTEIIRDSSWETVPVVRRVYSGPVGYVVPERMPRVVYPDDAQRIGGFPLNPSDGDEIHVNGQKYEWDADDNRWEKD
jgi:hypothetical protein